MMEFDQSKITFWRQLSTGDVLTLLDMQTQEWLIERGDLPSKGLRLTVQQIWKIKTNAFDMLIFEASGSASNGDTSTMYIVAKIVGSNMELRGYFIPDEKLNPGTRQELLDRGIQWLFNPPTSALSTCPECNEDNSQGELVCPNCETRLFVPGELEYRQAFDKETYSRTCSKCGTIAKSERETCSRCKAPLAATFEFAQKPQGVVSGECNDGSGEIKFVTVVEFSTPPGNCLNNQYMFVEIGGVSGGTPRRGQSNLLPEGGWVMLLQGCVISPHTDIK